MAAGGAGRHRPAPGAAVEEAVETVDGRDEEDDGAEPAEETDVERPWGLAGAAGPLPFALAETGEPVR